MVVGVGVGSRGLHRVTHHDFFTQSTLIDNTAQSTVRIKFATKIVTAIHLLLQLYQYASLCYLCCEGQVVRPACCALLR